MVLLANIIASPFAAATLITLAIAGLTVCLQALRTAVANPVGSLRSN
ncbi:hypothetical protein [Puia sp.]